MHRPIPSLTIKSILVLPEYRNCGVAVLLMDEMVKRTLPKGYEWADPSLTSEDSPNTPPLADRIGAQLYKRYRVYRMRIGSLQHQARSVSPVLAEVLQWIETTRSPSSRLKPWPYTLARRRTPRSGL